MTGPVFAGTFGFSNDLWQRAIFMNMKKRDLLFIVIVLVVFSGLYYLSVKGRHPQPTLQTVPEHQSLKPLTPRVECLTCHDPQAGTAIEKRIKANHPEKWKDEKFSCLGCHKLQPA
ncbi:MAG: hypothetical protein AB1489_04370 [Acidobacteriota bacterium]